MTKGVWLMIYGVLLFVCGAAVYLMNPAQAPTPLFAGTICGGLAAMIGVFVHKGMKWASVAGRMLMIVFLMMALAMAMQHWLLVKDGGKDLVTPLIDTFLVLASGFVLRELTRKA